VHLPGAHTLFTDPVINSALQNITGCLRPIPSDNLPILVGIQPDELHRKGEALPLACRAWEPGYLLTSVFT